MTLSHGRTLRTAIAVGAIAAGAASAGIAGGARAVAASSHLHGHGHQQAGGSSARGHATASSGRGARVGTAGRASRARRRAHAAATPAATATITLSKLAVSGTTLSLAGQVLTTHQNGALRIAVALTASGKRELHTLTPKATRFSLTAPTKLTGTVGVHVQALIGGKATGTGVSRTVTVGTAPTGTTPASTDPNAGAVTENLMGTFTIAPGTVPDSGAPTGSWLQILNSSGAPVANLSVASQDKSYTPLSPGTAGGLSTVRFQPAPSPAFAGAHNDAQAGAIIAPVALQGSNLSVITAATDAQTQGSDPLPQITYWQGALSGQVTAWTAQWNGSSFNQGAPSPGVALPPAAPLGAPAAPVTTPMTGTFNPATGSYTLNWQSPITAGPDAGDTGVWHLEGTFQGVTAPPGGGAASTGTTTSTTSPTTTTTAPTTTTTTTTPTTTPPIVSAPGTGGIGTGHAAKTRRTVRRSRR